jgi:predicted phosphohydrolase
MKIYAISDLHLSGENVAKPMDIFGEGWDNYIEEIQKDWDASVGEDDTVLIGGDISWAMYLEDARPDLDFIGRFKGIKILVRGNHDYWWKSISGVRAALSAGTHALQNDSIRIGRAVISGTRGWTVPEPTDIAGETGSQGNSAENLKIYNREVERLRLSLKDAAARRKEGDVLICLTHYPPFNSKHEESGFTTLFGEYKVDKVVYGHLHRPEDHTVLYYEKNGIEYYLTSCNMVNNRLVRILGD